MKFPKEIHTICEKLNSKSYNFSNLGIFEKDLLQSLPKYIQPNPVDIGSTIRVQVTPRNKHLFGFCKVLTQRLSEYFSISVGFYPGMEFYVYGDKLAVLEFIVYCDHLLYNIDGFLDRASRKHKKEAKRVRSAIRNGGKVEPLTHTTKHISGIRYELIRSLSNKLLEMEKNLRNGD